LADYLLKIYSNLAICWTSMCGMCAKCMDCFIWKVAFLHDLSTSYQC